MSVSSAYTLHLSFHFFSACVVSGEWTPSLEALKFSTTNTSLCVTLAVLLFFKFSWNLFQVLAVLHPALLFTSLLPFLLFLTSHRPSFPSTATSIFMLKHNSLAPLFLASHPSTVSSLLIYFLSCSKLPPRHFSSIGFISLLSHLRLSPIAWAALIIPSAGSSQQLHLLP